MNVVFVISLLVPIAVVISKSYDKFKVFEIKAENADTRKVLDLWKSKSKIDIWKDSVNYNDTVDLMVPPHLQGNFTKELLDKPGIRYKVISQSLQAFLKGKRRKWAKFGSQRNISFNEYYRHGEIDDYMQYLCVTYPKITEIINIGKSFEGRNMTVLHISANKSEERPSIFIDGGIHGREWIAPAQVLYIMYQLVENSNNNRKLIEQLDWYLLPVVNPDGYEFSHVRDRFWRKTRSRISNQTSESTDPCIGVDANRNFDFHWNETGGRECTTNFPGQSAFSEVETRNIREFATRLKNRLRMYLSFHSYGQYILHSWGHSSIERPENINDLRTLGEKVKKALRIKYMVGSTAALMYRAGGQSQDWFRGVLEVPFSYTIELPGGGEGGFDLPPEEIAFVVADMFNGIKVFADHIVKSNLTNSTN